MSNVPPEWYNLRNAVFMSDYPSAETLLQADPALLDAGNGIGETVLHYLAVENCLQGVSWLHARGASLDSLNKFGTPVLFEVAHLGYRDLFLWMLKNGADPKQPDRDKRSIREYLTYVNKPDMVAFVEEHVLWDS